MKKIKVSAVSYTNTKPFAYGIEHSDILNKIDLVYDIPSDCASKLINNQVDIGLVPVAALLNIPNYQILGNYCIGSVGAVNSVFIFSTKPIEEVKTVRLDPQSRTSNNLAKVLIKNYWKQTPDYILNGEADAFVEIGDRTFGKKQNYSFAYDLGEEWFKFTGLPFAFAVWASNKPIDQSFITEFDAALKLGLDSRDQVLLTLPQRCDFDLHDYLFHKLDFNLTDSKRTSIDKYLELVQKL
ncbi:Menaquinone via futalosine step 1 [Arcticibacter svalbardensis MN12-7]|uniref:Chorismate dehydratase n=1 Tax=Arcticibacter svalbardensis MN12-7 TaxID=1150600 RepID=R9GXJ0_9SPHI|nr:menaquinone biosynthesis protein [Arcticibacter svalbardensis]EOR96393.1 Menaquinone via futalosine step 1 [Arcticibacter svalbardensis MN12-7]